MSRLWWSCPATLGLFHSHKLAPCCIISNGLMIGMYDDQKNFNRAAALGVANYGQMTHAAAGCTSVPRASCTAPSTPCWALAA